MWGETAGIGGHSGAMWRSSALELTGVCEGNPSKDLVMEDMEPELAVFCKRATPSGGPGRPTEPQNLSAYNLQDVLGQWG